MGTQEIERFHMSEFSFSYSLVSPQQWISACKEDVDLSHVVDQETWEEGD